MKISLSSFLIIGASSLLIGGCANQQDGSLVKWLAEQQQARPIGPAVAAAPRPVPPPGQAPTLPVIVSAENGAAPIIQPQYVFPSLAADAPKPAARPEQVAKLEPKPALPEKPAPIAAPSAVIPPPAPPPPPVIAAPQPVPAQVAALPVPSVVRGPVDPGPAAIPVPPPAPVAAVVPPPPPKPKRGPLASPDELIGLTPDQVVIRLGQPNLKRHETPAEFWQYRSPVCLLELRLRPDNNELKVADTALRSHPGQPSTTAAACIAALNAALRPGT